MEDVKVEVDGTPVSFPANEELDEFLKKHNLGNPEEVRGVGVSIPSDEDDPFGAAPGGETAPPSPPQASLGDELPRPTPKSVRDVERKSQTVQSQTVHPPRHPKTIMQVVSTRLRAQVGMLVIGAIPLASRVVRAVLRALAGVDESPIEPVETTTDWVEHLAISGKKGEDLRVSVEPQYDFRSLRICAGDGLDGCGTRVTGFFVGGVPQFPLELKGGIQTRKLADRAFKSDWCTAGGTITFSVHFDDDCEWSCALFGEARA